MYFTNAILAVLYVNALLVAAAPAPAADAGAQAMSKRDDGVAKVFMCTDTRGKGDCQTQSIPLEACTELCSGYPGNVGTIKNTDSGKTHCTWFLTPDCTGSEYDNQDDENLSDGNGDFRSMRAVSCKKK